MNEELIETIIREDDLPITETFTAKELMVIINKRLAECDEIDDMDDEIADAYK
jgi:hypothetical protein